MGRRLSLQDVLLPLFAASVGVPFQPRVLAQLVINEIEYDQSGNDIAEFVEIYDPDRTGMSLAGWQLILYQELTGAPYRTVELGVAPGGVMPPDGYLVIGTSPNVPNVDIHQPGNWIRNDPCGMALVHNGVVIELLAYEGSFEGATDGTGGPAAGMPFKDIGVEDDATLDVTLQRSPDGGPWRGDYPEAAATPGRRNPSGEALLAIPRLVLMHAGAPDSGPIALCATGGVPPYLFTITGLPANGQLSHDTGPILSTPTILSGALRYTAAPGFSGLDSFQFRARDSVSTVANSVVQEVAVQSQDGAVVISEVMYDPSGDWRAFSYIEIHNRSAASVQLGRLDGDRASGVDTTGNLLGHTIPAGTTRVITTDASGIGIDAEGFRCEWNLREHDVIRIPLPQFETIARAPYGGDCAVPSRYRLLLFDAAGALLDAVDLGLVMPGLPASGQSLTIDDGLLSPPGPLDTRNNDTAGPWVPAGAPAVPGVRLSQTGDQGGPMMVPSLSMTYSPGECWGRCCLPGGACEDLSESSCAAAGGDTGSWTGGVFCGVGPAETESFIGCLSGPTAQLSSGCQSWDIDFDGDVDLRDTAAFQGAFSPPVCP